MSQEVFEYFATTGQCFRPTLWDEYADSALYLTSHGRYEHMDQKSMLAIELVAFTDGPNVTWFADVHNLIECFHDLPLSPSESKKVQTFSFEGTVVKGEDNRALVLKSFWDTVESWALTKDDVDFEWDSDYREDHEGGWAHYVGNVTVVIPDSGKLFWYANGTEVTEMPKKVFDIRLSRFFRQAEESAKELSNARLLFEKLREDRRIAARAKEAESLRAAAAAARISGAIAAAANQQAMATLAAAGLAYHSPSRHAIGRF